MDVSYLSDMVMITSVNIYYFSNQTFASQFMAIVLGEKGFEIQPSNLPWVNFR